MPAETEKVVFQKQVKLVRKYPEDLQSHFVVNLVVQHQPDFFILSFFEAWPPAIFGDTDEEKREAVEAVNDVEAKCVARLIVTPSKMREFLAVMKENLANYDQLMQMLSQEKQED